MRDTALVPWKVLFVSLFPFKKKGDGPGDRATRVMWRPDPNFQHYTQNSSEKPALNFYGNQKRFFSLVA
jgi:hypothetical protein